MSEKLEATAARDGGLFMVEQMRDLSTLASEGSSLFVQSAREEALAHAKKVDHQKAARDSYYDGTCDIIEGLPESLRISSNEQPQIRSDNNCFDDWHIEAGDIPTARVLRNMIWWIKLKHVPIEISHEATAGMSQVSPFRKASPFSRFKILAQEGYVPFFKLGERMTGEEDCGDAEVELLLGSRYKEIRFNTRAIQKPKRHLVKAKVSQRLLAAVQTAGLAELMAPFGERHIDAFTPSRDSEKAVVRQKGYDSDESRDTLLWLPPVRRISKSNFGWLKGTVLYPSEKAGIIAGTSDEKLELVAQKRGLMTKNIALIDDISELANYNIDHYTDELATMLTALDLPNFDREQIDSGREKIKSVSSV